MEQWLRSPKAATAGTGPGFGPSFLPCFYLGRWAQCQSCSLLLCRGWDQTIPTLGLSALEDQQPPFLPSLPSYLPPHSGTPDCPQFPLSHCPLPCGYQKQLSREVHASGGICFDHFGATFSLSPTRSGDTQAGDRLQHVYGLSALCIPGIFPLGQYRVWCKPLHTSVPQFSHYEERTGINVSCPGEI